MNKLNKLIWIFIIVYDMKIWNINQYINIKLRLRNIILIWYNNDYI